MITNLLCTFTDKSELVQTLTRINETYSIVYNYIYILQNCDEENNLYITYNIDTAFRPYQSLQDTILVHRKKQTNTLYTINALNLLVQEENNGQLDRGFEVNWENYRNSIILTNNLLTRKIPTKIYEIINLSLN